MSDQYAALLSNCPYSSPLFEPANRPVLVYVVSTELGPAPLAQRQERGFLATLSFAMNPLENHASREGFGER